VVGHGRFFFLYIIVTVGSYSNTYQTYEELEFITDRDNKISEKVVRARVAIVAPQDLMFGVSRMYEGMISNPGWSVGVFRTMNEAQNWLYSELPRKA